MADPYPRWRFFPAHTPAPGWVGELAAVFSAAETAIDSRVEHKERMESDAVLGVVSKGLQGIGFDVETGKSKSGKLPRPVFFGDEGSFLRTYEIDAFHSGRGIALEVEAGRATMGNAVYRDLVQASLMVDARFLVLAVPLEYRYRSGKRTVREPSYAKSYSVVEAIYGSERLRLPFEGLMLIGY